MNRRMAVALLLLLSPLPGAAAAGEAPLELEALVARLPADCELVLLGDLRGWLAEIDVQAARFEALPALVAHPEARDFFRQQKAILDETLAGIWQQIGLDPKKDLGPAAVGLAITGHPEPVGVALVSGTFPAELPGRAFPEGPSAGDARCESPSGPCLAVRESGRLLVLAANRDSLAALDAGAGGAGPAGRLGLTFGPQPKDLWLRLAGVLPEEIRARLRADPTLPVATLVGGLVRAQLDLNGDRLQLVLGCSDEPAAAKAGRLLQALGESAAGGVHVWRMYGYLALAFRPASWFTEAPPVLRAMLEDRPALERTLGELLPRPSEPVRIGREGLSVRFEAGARLMQGSAVWVGVMAAVAIPSFVQYIRRSKQSEGIEHLHALALAEENYRTEHGQYLACGPTPPQPPGESMIQWPGDPCFDKLGFQPDKTYFSFQTLVTEDGALELRAWADLDGDEDKQELRRGAGPGRQVDHLNPFVW